jgi:subtilisin
MMPPRPAWAKESMILRLNEPVTINDLSPAWAFDGATGDGVRVAIVDSGIDFDHPMLEGCVDTESAIEFAVGDDGAVEALTGEHRDAYGHGTACAGIIHALAPKARLTSVRVLGPGLTGKAAAFHAGLLWAVEQGFDIINLSLGTSKKDWALAFHEVCDRAYFGNSFIVTAANNVARESYPSLFASVASVACNTSTDPLRFHANPEPPTEFLARGIDVEVPWLQGGTTVTTGNSFAAPHIAGLAALIKSKHPELRPFHLKTVLWATSANVREASEIEVAGRRGTVFSTGYRATNYRATNYRATNYVGTDDQATGLRSSRTGAPPVARATIGRAESAHHPVLSDGTSKLAAVALSEALPAIAISSEVVDRGPTGVVRQGTMRADGSVVTVRDLSSLDAEVVHRAAPRLHELMRLALPNIERIVTFALEPVPAVATLELTSLDLFAPGPPDPAQQERAIRLLLAAADALTPLHDRGIVHGDLGPGDLCRDRESGFVLGGLVRSSIAPTATLLAGGRSLTTGNLRYLAREQLEGVAATFATDVHSLGLIGTLMVAGRLPYPDVERVGDLLRQRIGSDPMSVSTLAPELASSIAAVLDVALRPNPSVRYPTARALAIALRDSLC